jgi:hypothetical protein
MEAGGRDHRQPDPTATGRSCVPSPGKSELDAQHMRVLTHSESDLYAGEASGYLEPNGAALTFVFGAQDEIHAVDRAKFEIGPKLEEYRTTAVRATVEVTRTTLLMGEVDPRMAFSSHIGGAVSALISLDKTLVTAREKIEAGLVYADELGQQRAVLEGMIADVAALRELLDEKFHQLIQRLAEVEAGTRG